MSLEQKPTIDKLADYYENAMNTNMIMKMFLKSTCLLYTSDAADDLLCVDLGGRRIHKKKKNKAVTVRKRGRQLNPN